MHLGLIGFGNIASTLLEVMQPAPTRVTALVRAGSRTAAQTAAEVNVVTEPAALIAVQPDLVVEAAGHEAVDKIVPQVLEAGIDVMVVSVGALADAARHETLNRAAERGGARMIFPSGAIGGRDLLAALAHRPELRVVYQGIKPPGAWKGSAAEDHVDLDRLISRTVFFAGEGRAAALAFPKNANVVAALALAGPGFEKVSVELIADPDATGNIHAYSVTCDLCRYEMHIENAASPGNARTSLTTIYSVASEIAAYSARMRD